MPSLRACFDKHGCDRGKRHGYERVYEPLFAPLRRKPLRILEIGIFEGAGIAAWLEYFSRAVVHGIDTFQRVAPEHITILDDDGVFWWRQDSTAGVPTGMSGSYDLIFDDGAHDALSQRKTLEHYRPLCRGMYFIEDVWQGKPGYAELLAALPEDAIHHKLKGAVDSYIIQC